MASGINPAGEPPGTSLILTVEPGLLSEFTLLLQRGFDISLLVNCSLENILQEQWHIAPECVTGRISTIFVNSHPIDDLSSTIIREGDVLSLSGAMPGLVGATMRRGGFYANLRGDITYQEQERETSPRLARIHVKIFNLLLRELGPGFLQRGIILGLPELAGFLKGKTEELRDGCTSALLNSTNVSPRDVASTIDPAIGGSILFRVTLNS